MKTVFAFFAVFSLWASLCAPALAAPAKPDFRITSISVNSAFDVQFTVANTGPESHLGQLWFKLWDNDEPVDEWSVSISLSTNEQKTVVSDYNLAVPSPRTKGQIRVKVDSRELISETNDYNNELETFVSVPLHVTNINIAEFRKNVKLHQQCMENPRINIPITFKRVPGKLASDDRRLNYRVRNTYLTTAYFDTAVYAIGNSTSVQTNYTLDLTTCKFSLTPPH